MPPREHDVRNRRMCPPSRGRTPRTLRVGGALTRRFPNLTFAVARRHRPSLPVALGQLARLHPLSRMPAIALTFEPGPPPREPGERLPQARPRTPSVVSSLRATLARATHSPRTGARFELLSSARHRFVRPPPRTSCQRRRASFELGSGRFRPGSRCARSTSATRNHETWTRALGSRPRTNGDSLARLALRQVRGSQRFTTPGTARRGTTARGSGVVARGPLVDLRL